MIGQLSAHDTKQLRSMIYIYSEWTDDYKWADYNILCNAIERRNMRVVHFLLGKGCRVIKPGSNVLPLHLAVRKLGWYNTIEKLLALGARITERDNKGDTALHVAFVNYASDNVIDLLLERYLLETDENLCNKEGISFLHIACTRPNVEIIRDFVMRGQADVNSQMLGPKSIFSGCTPLHFAAEYSQPAMVKFLLDHNAELYARDRSGSTALLFALERRDVPIIDLILSYDRRHENIVNIFGLSHFMAACAGTNEVIVHKFLRVAESQPRTSVSALIDMRSRDVKFAGYNSMLFAAEFGRNQTLRFLSGMAERESHVNSFRKPIEGGEKLISDEANSFGRLLGFSHILIALVLFFTFSLPTWFLF